MSGSSTCRSCGRPIVWAVSQQGKNIPMDPEPTPRGTHKMSSSTIDGRIHFQLFPKAASEVEDTKLYCSHFVTCPNAAQHRRPR